jgi:hypothetical protein
MNRVCSLSFCFVLTIQLQCVVGTECVGRSETLAEQLCVCASELCSSDLSSEQRSGM